MSNLPHFSNHSLQQDSCVVDQKNQASEQIGFGLPLSTDKSSYHLTEGKSTGKRKVDVVAGYLLGHTLGKGSCGVVKLGTHIETGKKYAIKVLKPKSDREKKEISREIEALKLLKHPNIINLHEVIYGSNLRAECTSDLLETTSPAYPMSPSKERNHLSRYIFVVMELAEGGELFEMVLKNGPIEEKRARGYFRQLISALEYCHAHLICHRDLKPENILFDSNGQVKISDFGLSNVAKSNRLFRTFCGSPIYAPPEIVMEQEYRGWSVDIWSLGIVLYIMITGGMPWRLENGVVRDVELFLSGNYCIPNSMGISEECQDLIEQLIQPNPENRPNMRTIMKHPWTTNKGALPSPHCSLRVPSNAVKLLTQYESDGANGHNVNIDEEILQNVQDVIGLDRRGLYEARVSIQKLQACPALTAYCALARQQTKPTMLVKDSNLPNYMRHKRNRSELPKVSAFFLADDIASQGSNSSPQGSPHSPARIRANTITIKSTESNQSFHEQDAFIDDSTTNHENSFNSDNISDNTTESNPSCNSDPSLYPSEVCLYRDNDDRLHFSGQILASKSSKEEKHRHSLRTLLLKIRWGIKTLSPSKKQSSSSSSHHHQSKISEK